MSQITTISSKKISRGKNFSFNPRRIKIKIIGLGAGGNSIISEIAKTLKGLSFFAIDSDPRSFKGLSKKIKIFHLEQELSQSIPLEEKKKTELKAGEKPSLILKEKIRKIFQDVDLIILVSCLGGRIGSYFLPIFSQALNQMKKLSIGIFILPFSFEDERKIFLAKNNLKEFKGNFSGVAILENDKILKQTEKNIPLRKSFSLMNQILANYLQDFIEVLSGAGIINIDFADFQTILRGKGQLVYFSRGKGQGINKTEETLKELLENSPFVLPLKIKKILFNIRAGFDLTLKEVEKIGREIYNLNPQAKIIFGVFQDRKFEKKIKITLLGVGDNLIKESKEKKNKEELKEKKQKKEIGQEKIKIEDELKKKEETRAIKKTSQKRKKIKTQRRNGLEIKKIEKKNIEDKIEDKEEKEIKWEIPSFLRNI